jgi:hypothetical protein
MIFLSTSTPANRLTNSLMKTPVPPSDPNNHLPYTRIKTKRDSLLYSSKPLQSPTQSKLLTRFPALHRLHLLHPTIPLPSLLISFGVLHEITAFVPLVAVFYGLKAVGGGRSVVRGFVRVEDWVRGRESVEEEGEGQLESLSAEERDQRAKEAAALKGVAEEKRVTRERARGWVEGWLAEGEKKVERFGQKYGVFGYVKRSHVGVQWLETQAWDEQQAKIKAGYDVAGDVANALGAYLIVKVSSRYVACLILSMKTGWRTESSASLSFCLSSARRSCPSE